MSYQPQLTFAPEKAVYYPYVETAPSQGQQLDSSLLLLSRQTDETRVKKISLLETYKVCEEQEKILRQNIVKLSEQVEDLHKKRVEVFKELMSSVMMPEDKISMIRKIIGATGRIIKQNWATALLTGIVVGGAVWIYEKSCSHSGGHYSSYY